VALGQAPFDWARPDGQPEDGAAWSSVSRVLASFETHYTLCGGWWPTVDTTYHPIASWVPIAAGQTIRFDALVEHLSRTLLGRTATGFAAFARDHAGIWQAGKRVGKSE